MFFKSKKPKIHILELWDKDKAKMVIMNRMVTIRLYGSETRWKFLWVCSFLFPALHFHPPSVLSLPSPFHPLFILTARGSEGILKLRQRVRTEPGRKATFGAFWAEKCFWRERF